MLRDARMQSGLRALRRQKLEHCQLTQEDPAQSRIPGHETQVLSVWQKYIASNDESAWVGPPPPKFTKSHFATGAHVPSSAHSHLLIPLIA